MQTSSMKGPSHIGHASSDVGLRSPYQRYHVHRNPFGELDRAQRAELAILDVQPWIKAFADAQTVLQFIGDCGNGKTTHLLAIHRAVPASKYIYLPESGPHPKIPEHRPLLVDEAQRLSAWRRSRMLRRGGQLILGTHIDLGASIQRAGLESRTVPVAQKTNPSHLLRIMNRRLEASSLSNRTPHFLTIEHARWLYTVYGSNIRAAEHFLYEEFQQCVEQQSAWPPNIERWTIA